MEDLLKQRLANQIASGELILFTGAGFSLNAVNRTGTSVPGVRRLREVLWSIAFPEEDFDEGSSLGDIYQVAARRAGNKVKDALRNLLIVDGSSIPDVYRKWFSMPWLRVYTLNVDDLDEAVERSFELPRQIQSISAIRDSYPNETTDLLSIHLNGRVEDYPDVTFSPQQYAERAARHEPWYSHLVADVTSHPVLYVGTELNESLLWQHIELRGRKARGLRDLRPGSYLVTPSISAARAAMLDEFNIKLIKMNQEEFVTRVLDGMEAERQKGLKIISARLSPSAGGRYLFNVADLRTQKDDGTGEFLLGREPYWSDITSSLAVEREFEADLRDKIQKTKERVILLTGTAGSGKSTTLMRLALAYHAEGKQVGWLDSEVDLPLWQIKEAVRNSKYQVLAIDDADNFSHKIGSLLAELSAENPDTLILAGMRSTRLDRLQVEDYLKQTAYQLFVLPHLEDSDIELLLDALTKAHRLGTLRGLSHDQQVAKFKESAGRQLLVAMIQATSNERFEEKIDKECKDLDPDQGLIYCIVAIANHLRASLTKDEILLATGDSTNNQLNRIQRLRDQRLLVSPDGQLIRLRHRVIADRVVDFYRLEGSMREPIIGLLWAIATKATAEQSRKSREQKLLLKLMNHETLINLTSDQETPRLAYADVENLSSWNYHYYLQRGSYDVETNNLDSAKNLLDQARQMAPNDYLVQTEWAYMTLKRAARNSGSVGAEASANEAFTELEDAIAKRGKYDYYPYHVLGSQGLGWIRRAVISPNEKIRLLSRIHNIVQEGVKNFPRQRELEQLAKDIHEERLMMTVK
jgi:energy-coupling factor transporter ATP-binding protein EcfA2